jgi:hypothetical protein
MTSELKSATARANGAKSRGPKSPETQEKSSRNALKHGYTARQTIVLECENEGQFQEMRADYVATYQPGSPVENSLVDEMACARWRMLRLRMIEAALLDSEMNRETEDTPSDPGYQIAAAFRRLADESRSLSLASGYESRLARIHERSHRTLRELQQTRKQQTADSVSPEPAQPEPPPANPSVEHLDKKSPNEPTLASSSATGKPAQRPVVIGHRGIRSYLGTQRFRRPRHLEVA